MSGRSFRILVLGVVAVLAVAAVVWLAGIASPETAMRPSGSVDAADLPAGTARAVYLDGGVPAFVVRHDDGRLQLISAFDAHRPGVNQLLWWCPASTSFEGPATGSRYDEYGVKYSGPAPAGLESWSLSEANGTATVGSRRPVPSVGAPYVGGAPDVRPNCTGGGEEVYHRFDGWRVWSSPSELVDAKPSGWQRVDGVLQEGDGGPELCAIDGCGDAARVSGITVPPPDFVAMLPLHDRRWLARVEGGRIVDLTRIVDPAG